MIQQKTAQEGLLSICIPVWNQIDITNECIQAIMENTEAGTYEIIIIDNGSVPPFASSYKIRVIRNHENKGFPIAINQGIAMAKGDNIVVLNNDVIVTPGAINRLIKWLDVYDIVGPATNYSIGIQCIQIPVYKNVDELNKVARTYMKDNKGQSEAVSFIIGFCMVFKRSLFNHIGAFDNSLWPCSGEEIDFCLRSHQKGYKIGIARDVYVHHIGSCTLQALDDEGQIDYTEICDRNDNHLAERWGNDWLKKQLIQGEMKC